jgi:tetratricopeptide (TPR) repeat protein
MEQQLGDTSQAVSSFQHANRLNPSLYVPNLFLGIDYVSEGKAKEAIPFLLKAEKSNGNDPQSRLALGRAYIALDKYLLAAQAYKHAVDLNPKQSSTWFSLGIAYLDQMETDSRKLSAKDQNSSYAKALFAESLDKQSRYAEAAKIYMSVLDIKPQPPCLHSELGWTLLRQQRRAEAVAAFKVDQEISSPCALAMLGQARLAIDANEGDEALKLISQLWARDQGFVTTHIAMLADGVTADSATSFSNVLSERHDATSAALYKLLTSALSGTTTEIAGDAIERDAKKSPSTVSGTVAHGTAEAYYQAGEYQRCSDRLSSTRPTTSDKLLLFAMCSYFAGDFERTSEASAVLAGLAPGSVAGLYWSIKANEKLAFQALARYEELEPNSARSHILLGDIWRQRLAYTEALDEYRKAQQIDPSDQAAMLGISSAYLGNNDIEKAIQTARTALLKDPDDPELNLIMAEALIAHHDYAEAEPYLNKSLKAKPQMLPHVHALLGRVYAETGRNTDAIAQLKLGVESDSDGSVHYQLARLYRETGDGKSAAAALEQMKTIQKHELERERTNFEEVPSAPPDKGPQ